MQGRDPGSVHLSLLYYLSAVLPEPWDIQPQRREPQTRPLCVCQPVGPSPSGGSAFVREYTQQYEVLAYPPGADADPAAARGIASSTRTQILRAFDSGYGVGAARGYSMRVPLFDFTGLAGAPPDGTLPIDYLVIQALSGDVRQDPEQDDLYTVLVDFRVNWRDDGDLRRFEGATLAGVGAVWRPA